MFKSLLQSRNVMAAAIVVGAALLFAVLLPLVSPFPGWAAGLLGLGLGFLAGLLTMLGHGTSREGLVSVFTGIGAARRGERPIRPSEPTDEVSELLGALDSVANDVQARNKRLRETETKRDELSAQLEERERRLAQSLQKLDGLADEWSAALREENEALDRLDAVAASTNGSEAGGRRAQLLAETDRAAETMHRAGDEVRTLGNTSTKAHSAFEALRARTEAMRSAIEDAEQAAAQAGLVAVNVAILAAQAGESGRAFTVASEEVKELVDRAGGAMRALDQLVGALASETEHAVGASGHDAATIERLARATDEGERILRELAELHRTQPRRTETVRDAATQLELVRELVRAHERRVAILGQACERLRAPSAEHVEPERT